MITTATDVNHLFAVDLWAKKQQLAIINAQRIKAVSAKILAGEEVTVSCPWPVAGELPELVALGSAGDVSVTTAVLGVGCRKGITGEQLEDVFQLFCEKRAFYPEAICAVASVDRKEREPGLRAFCKARGWPLRCFSAEELNALPGVYSGSDFVRQTVGTDNVCERAAVLASGGSLIEEKFACGGVTFALAAASGDASSLTERAHSALAEANLICGYNLYVDLVRPLFPEKEFFATGMTGEVERCRVCLEEAAKGKTVALVCSGDAGIYGMASPALEMAPAWPQVEVTVIPGVTAALSGGALLGAPLGHDFCVISLSDRLTDWALIEKRLRCASEGDFAVCLYNPASRHRTDYLRKACDILLESRSPATVCGLTRAVGREGEEWRILSLSELREWPADMFTTVFIGSSSTKEIAGRMVTPRGYRP